MLSAVIAISLGASAGAVLRWVLSNSLNHFWPQLPLGTLCANLLGGYLIGIVMALLAQQPSLPAEWRLFLITGFLGGLTTFSTFSAEVVYLLQQQKWGWAVTTMATHLFGSLLLTALGLLTVSLLKR